MPDIEFDARPINPEYERLVSRVEITRECRYAAEKRLQRRNERAYYVISMMSLFVIIVSVLPNVHGFSSLGLQWLLLITIVNSVFIIVTTLVDAGGNYSLNEYFMRESARKLDLVLNKLILATERERRDFKWLRGIYSEYQTVLHECPSDHKPVDYLAVQVYQQHLFKTRWVGLSPVSKSYSLVSRYLKLHYYRSKWMLPHMAVVLFSAILIAELWYPEVDHFGLKIFSEIVARTGNYEFHHFIGPEIP